MMEQSYRTLLGGSALSQRPVVEVILPRPGENEFKFVVAQAIDKEYWQYGYRVHPKAVPVNVFVYGDQQVIERVARTRHVAVCEVEVVEKTTKGGKKYCFLNLKLVHPRTPVTHTFGIVPKTKSNHKFFFTTDDMHGVGIGVSRI